MQKMAGLYRQRGKALPIMESALSLLGETLEGEGGGGFLKKCWPLCLDIEKIHIFAPDFHLKSEL